jgi:uncharacterized protein (DUF1330 family)
MADTRCYMFVLGAFTDRERFLATYQVAVAPLIERFGGRYLLVGRGVQVLEGDFPGGGGCVVSVWPDRVAALAFWNSPEYAEVKRLREGTGEFQVVLVDAPAIGSGGESE